MNLNQGIETILKREEEILREIKILESRTEELRYILLDNQKTIKQKLEERKCEVWNKHDRFEKNMPIYHDTLRTCVNKLTYETFKNFTFGPFQTLGTDEGKKATTYVKTQESLDLFMDIYEEYYYAIRSAAKKFPTFKLTRLNGSPRKLEEIESLIQKVAVEYQEKKECNCI